MLIVTKKNQECLDFKTKLGTKKKIILKFKVQNVEKPNKIAFGFKSKNSDSKERYLFVQKKEQN